MFVPKRSHKSKKALISLFQCADHVLAAYPPPPSSSSLILLLPPFELVMRKSVPFAASLRPVGASLHVHTGGVCVWM